ncbi:hypothetical protein ASPZODRAFT_90735 [Penicilliopsis zonata CBS 506.65]|uniref:Uncharacterized protein n=1 Tax=Penicilliopsis zonata CBS 506.65 TaxID=1073090 RepID=A0A1L9SP77_9EURO|nr:hypothetical protein ASPZODRAFT_90735 [Penicilliopsis zonata CBS 506.65]OJJ48827.1 hypothetical protein ASPZODRAFT_90735 [Penicilliopsis zonata CBS 506.65]
MSGNYDYPPASRRSSRSNNNAARLQHLRALLTSERNLDNHSTARAWETLNRELEEHRADRDRSTFEQARAVVDRRLRQLQTDLGNSDHRPRRLASGQEYTRHPPVTVNLASMNQDTTSSDSTISNTRPSRRRPMRTGERAQNSQQFPLQGRVRDSGLNHLLDQPIPRLESSTVLPPSMESDRDLNRWRAKRRKLESDDSREGLRSFNYGQYGQVVSGPLKMEIVSCDGGTYEHDGERSWPENVLRNDSAVYCTKSDRCNLVLRHRGEAPFCLRKLIIKAPKTGFDAPIQEGMIFVSMSSDELLARTAQYQIQYSATARSRRRNRRTNISPSQEYMSGFRPPLQSLERTILAGPGLHSDSENDSPAVSGLHTSDTSGQIADFQVTTEYDNHSDAGENDTLEDAEDDNHSIAQLDRIQLEQLEDDLLCPESDESTSEDDEARAERNHQRFTLGRRLIAAGHLDSLIDIDPIPRRRQIPSLIEPLSSVGQPVEMSMDSTEVLKPHARFFIKREKSMVSIKFDPPPSGRFILIKLWSPHSGGNIDIQSIIAHGFAGPRFFPATSVR